MHASVTTKLYALNVLYQNTVQKSTTFIEGKVDPLPNAISIMPWLAITCAMSGDVKALHKERTSERSLYSNM